MLSTPTLPEARAREGTAPRAQALENELGIGQ
jgi:hypothetical protein